MTIDELGELGRQCLAECEGQLTVSGVRPFDHSAKNIQEPMARALAAVGPQEMKPIILSVLQRLAEVGAFVMSESEFTEPAIGVNHKNVAYNDLRLTFTEGFDKKNYTPLVWVACWYYPTQR